MKISVLMPVFNEENTITEILQRVAARQEAHEIVVVNDGSTDSTWEKIEKFSLTDKRIVPVNLPKNLGKGGAIKEGLSRITGDIVIIQDSDLEYDPADYPRLLSPFEDPGMKVVYGTRLINRENKFIYPFFTIGGIMVTLFANILYLTWITDEPTGYKVFRTEILKKMNLKSLGFEFCPEVTAKVLRSGVKIHEVLISYKPRRISEGKKIRFKDGLMAFWTLFYYRFFE